MGTRVMLCDGSGGIIQGGSHGFFDILMDDYGSEGEEIIVKRRSSQLRVGETGAPFVTQASLFPSRQKGTKRRPL